MPIGHADDQVSEKTVQVEQSDRNVIEGRELPRFTLPNEEFAAPPGMQGTVLLAFSLDSKGNLVNPSVLSADPVRLEKYALRVLKNMRFQVPSDWGRSHYVWQRYWLGIIFREENCRMVPKLTPQELWGMKIGQLSICRSRVKKRE